jgi:hypothetical protein
MNRVFLTAVPVIAATLVLGACASAPDESAARTAALDCTAIDGEMTRVTEAQRAAEQQQHDAWKVVVPFAVMARYGKAKAAADESRQQLADLQQQAASRGCAISRN